jgi:hypothetical protein
MSAGRAIASRGNAGAPERAFDARSDTYWVSVERGQGIKNQAWIGYAFGEPQAVRRIIIEQTTNPPFRQDFVNVEKSEDGIVWMPAAGDGPARLKGPRSTIKLPAGTPSRFWRLVAAADNAVADGHAWTPGEINLFVAGPTENSLDGSPIRP